MDYQLEVLVEVRSSFNVEKSGSFADKFGRRGWLGIEISVKVHGENMDEVDDAISHSLSYIAILH